MLIKQLLSIIDLEINSMTKLKGIKSYKQYWVEQAEFMDKDPWSKDKVVKINFHLRYEDKLKELQFSNHSIDRDSENLIVRLKVPYNYYDIDDFESKLLETLGIEMHWILSIEIDDASCKSLCW